MKKAISLCGGGSKGAYQMGVWTCLKELGEDFDIITGTSIGALNGAMMFLGEYDRCLSLWNEVTINHIVVNGFNIDGPLVQTMFKKKNDILPFLKTYIKNLGADITPFYKLLDEYIIVEKAKNNPKKLGIVAASFPTMKQINFIIDDENYRNIKKYLLASSSCFPAFPVCKIDGRSYVDGGYSDNLPINLAFELGADFVLAVDLNVNITHKEHLNNDKIKYIVPSWPLGSFLHFEREIIHRNQVLGYNDCLKAYKLKRGFKYTFEPYYFAEDFYKLVIEDFIKMTNEIKKRRIKTLVRPEKDGNIFNLLENSTLHPLTDEEYVIRALEIGCEIFSMEYIVIYHPLTLGKRLLLKVFTKSVDVEAFKNDIDQISNKNKLKNYFLGYEDAYLAALLIQNDNLATNEILINLMLSKPQAFITYIFLKHFKDYDFQGDDLDDFKDR